MQLQTIDSKVRGQPTRLLVARWPCERHDHRNVHLALLKGDWAFIGKGPCGQLVANMAPRRNTLALKEPDDPVNRRYGPLQVPWPLKRLCYF